MDNRMMKRNGSNVWPYVVVGSAIGGAVGYLMLTESGKKIRHSVTHPDEMANNLEEARRFIEQKARVVTEQVHNVIGKAKRGIEDGERAYREAGQQYRARVVGQIENKSNEITSGVHNTVDKVSRTATTIEQNVLDPIVEIGALVRGVERGIRSLLGKTGPVPVSRDTRMMGS
jgi:gas vesicle protein